MRPHVRAYMHILTHKRVHTLTSMQVFMFRAPSQLIRRRYFSDELPAPSPWSISSVQGTSQRLDENLSDDDPFYKNTSLRGDPYKYNMLPPLPAQRNLTPPPTLYPQQPASMPENYSYPRFSLSSAQELSSTVRSKRTDINV